MSDEPPLSLDIELRLGPELPALEAQALETTPEKEPSRLASIAPEGYLSLSQPRDKSDKSDKRRPFKKRRLNKSFNSEEKKVTGGEQESRDPEETEDEKDQDPPKLLPELESQDPEPQDPEETEDENDLEPQLEPQDPDVTEDLKQQVKSLTKELDETKACMIMAQDQSHMLQLYFEMLEKHLIRRGFTCERGPEGVLTLVEENECSSSTSSTPPKKKRKMT